MKDAAWSVRCCQLQPGSLEVRAQTVQFPGLTLHQIVANLSLEIEGSALDDRLSILISRADSGVSVNSRVAGGDSLVIVQPSAQVLIVTPEGAEFVLLRIDRRQLKGRARNLLFSSGSDVAEKPITKKAKRDLWTALDSVFYRSGKDAPKPEAGGELLRLFTDLTNSAPESGPAADSKQWRALLAARALMNTHLPTVVRINELCHLLDTSRSTLERQFRAHLGVTPLQYITIHRLTEVRQELRTCEPDSHCVAIVARRNGFRHLGRFSMAYKKHFGESPSETLRRA